MFLKCPQSDATVLADCCAQQRTYEKFFGLLAQRFCQLNKAYIEPFQVLGAAPALSLQ